MGVRVHFFFDPPRASKRVAACGAVTKPVLLQLEMLMGPSAEGAALAHQDVG